MFLAMVSKFFWEQPPPHKCSLKKGQPRSDFELDPCLEFDNSMLLNKRSGKHIRRSEKGDMAKIVKQLLSQDALTKTPGRSYGFYSDMKPTLLNNLVYNWFYNWISDHKGYMILHRKAR